MKGISNITKKGQAATEFLMTYGWAILAIVIVAAVLWNMGVFKGQCAKTAPVQVFGAGEQLQASDWSLGTDNVLTMKVKNLAGNDITINAGNLNVSGATPLGSLVGAPIVAAGGDETITFTGITAPVGTAGNCFTGTINMTYTVTSGVDHPISGSIRGKY